jgi:ubiquinone/menaquinone biosynthesis C-methylase UbiE
MEFLLLVLVLPIGLRLWFRVFPQPIPYGWAWLLENPWRKHYRQPEQLANKCKIAPNDTVLEVGCGSGLFTPHLAKSCAKLISQDLDERYVAQAKQKVATTNVQFLVGDVCQLQLEAVADVVLLISVLPEIPDPVAALRACKTALKPNGRIVVSQEFFEPEYVTSGRIDQWAQAAGLKLQTKEGNFWLYYNTYVVA